MNELINRNLRCIKADKPEYGPLSAYDLATSFAKIEFDTKTKEAEELQELYSSVPKTAKELVELVVRYFEKEKIGITRAERAVILTAELYAFVSDFDPYEYKDQIDDPEKHTEEITRDLLVGDTSAYLECLESAAEQNKFVAKELHKLVRLFLQL